MVRSRWIYLLKGLSACAIEFKAGLEVFARGHFIVTQLLVVVHIYDGRTQLSVISG